MLVPARADDQSAPARRSSDRHYWRVDFDGDEVTAAFLDAVLAALWTDEGPEPSGEPGSRAAASREAKR
jgi:hypothetical protein